MNQDHEIYDSFEEAANKIKKKSDNLRRSLIDKSITALNAGLTISTASELSSWFNKKFKLIFVTVGKQFDAKLNKALLKDIADKLTDKELKRLLKHKSIMLDDMKVISRRMRRDIKEKVIKVLNSDIAFSKAVKEIKTIYPSFSRHSETVLNSYLQRTYRNISYNNQKKINYPYYKYAGPKDKLNRTYCAKHVQKVFTAKEAEEHQKNMASFYGCRHTLRGQWKK